MGAEGALAAARSDAIILEMSTVSPETPRKLHAEARRTRVQFLDAPVSGSTPQAEQGQLVIFVGGEEAVYNQCRPILGVLGKASFYLGPSGSGATMKLCVNALLGLGVQALAESIALGLKSGLDRMRLLDALAETAVLSASQKSKLENARTGVYPATFALRLMYKDFGLIMNTATELSVPMPITAAAQQVCAIEHGQQSASGRDEDFSSVILRDGTNGQNSAIKIPIPTRATRLQFLGCPRAHLEFLGKSSRPRLRTSSVSAFQISSSRSMEDPETPYLSATG